MPVMPSVSFLATRPVLAEGMFGTLRHETGTYRYWMDDKNRVWIEQRLGEGEWAYVGNYDGSEVPV